MKTIKKIPVPFFGVGLGFAGLANLLHNYQDPMRGIQEKLALLFLIMSFIVAGVTLIRVLADHKSALKEIGASASAGCTICTLFMAMMLQMSLIQRYSSADEGAVRAVTEAVWVFAFAADMIVIIWFTWRYVLHFKLEDVTPAWLIPYVGIAVASLGAPVFGLRIIGDISLWIAVICALPILAASVIRYKKIPMPTGLRPFFTLFAAPFSLTLAGLLALTDTPAQIVITMFIIGQALYFMVLARLPKLMSLPFMPSFTAFTFPLVLPAMAAKKFALWLYSIGAFSGGSGDLLVPVMTVLLLFEIVTAVVLVTAVLCIYIKNIARD